MRPIDIGPANLETVRRILYEHTSGLEVRAFGSRVSWTARETSDLDLAMMTAEPLNIARMAELKATFTESDLPFRVDIVDWASTSESFRKVIEREYVVLAEKKEQRVGDDWRECIIADACSSIDYGLTASASSSKTGPHFLRITDIVSGHIDWKRVPHVVVDNDIVSKYRLYDGDIVIARTGASTGASMYVKNPPLALFASYLVRLQAKPDFDPRFLAYFLKSKEFLEFIRGVLGDKSAQPNASASTMTAAPLRVPKNKGEQRAIAHILGTLDDKIELNRRMNETLEAMARALFKSWFVDFDPVRAKAALKRHAAAHAPLEEESAYITPPLRGSRQGKDEVRGRAGGGTNRWGDIKRQYTQQTLQNAKTLRQTQTNAEGLLWDYLRDKQLDGHNFRRQQPIGPYIADFACMSQKLLIELDGGGHTERKAHDRERDEFLRQRGYRVLRFWNNEVFENCLGVLERVYEALTSPPPRQPIPVGLAAVTPPQGGSDLMDEWTLERARTYLDGMGEEIAALFPDSFVDSELGEIPEGWGVGTLGDMLHQRVERCRASEETASRPYVPIDCISPKSLFLTESKPGEEAKSSLTKFYTGDILFGAMRPYFHKVCIAPFDGTTRTTAFVFYPKREHDFAFATLLLHDPDTIDFATRNSTGSTIPYAVWADSMEAMGITVPTSGVLKAFNDTVRPLLMRIPQRYFESRALATLRDVLLPRLVSGEIRVRHP